MSFAEKGAVTEIEPALYVGYLNRLKATGTLKFDDAPVQRAIYFREGRILFSSSNAPEDQLGAILVAAGKITQDQFDALVAALAPKQSIASALAQGGHVSQRDIGDAARRKVGQIVGACCAQTSGNYEFEDGVLPKGALDMKLTTEKVLIDAFEVLEPSGFLIRILKSPMAVLAAAEVDVTDPDLARVREALDGISSLSDIGGRVGLPLAATEARAAVLVVLGAAVVVTSQIEEMTLPDTGETSPGLPALSLFEEGDPIEAETPSFEGSASEGMPQFEGESTLVIPPLPEGSFSGSGDATMMMGGDSDSPPLGSADVTMVMPSGLESPGSGSTEATLMMPSGLDISPPRRPSDSGVSRKPVVKRDKARTQDLAAVSELLGASPPTTAPRPGSASLPAQRWEPKLSADGRSGRGRRGLAGALHSPMVRRLAVLGVVAGLAFIGWIAYTATQPDSRPIPSSGTPSSTPTPTPTSSAAGSGAQLPGVPLPAPPSAATAPAVGSAAPSPTVTRPAPVVTPSALSPEKGAASPGALPASATTPAQAPATPAAPAAVPNRPTAGSAAVSPGSVVSGYEAMKAGRLADAATTFASIAQGRAAEFSVQILVACSAQTIEKAIQNDPSPDLFILPATLSSKPCHRLMRGFYKTEGEAAQAVSALPPYYVAEGAKPKAIAMKAALR